MYFSTPFENKEDKMTTMAGFPYPETGRDKAQLLIKEVLSIYISKPKGLLINRASNIRSLMWSFI